MFTCPDGKSGELSSQTSEMLYKPPGAVYKRHIRNHSTNHVAGPSLFSSEIILIIVTYKPLQAVYTVEPQYIDMPREQWN